MEIFMAQLLTLNKRYTKICLIFMVCAVLLLTGCNDSSKKLQKVEPIYGPTNPDPAIKPNPFYAAVIELKPEKEKEYRQLHADVWPEVLATVKKANIKNFNIFTTELFGKKYLFYSFEYTGNDPEKDLGAIGDDPTTRDKWWPVTDACQTRLPGTPEGEQWKAIEMIMHVE
jgi:L-rhamnose mutarotase